MLSNLLFNHRSPIFASPNSSPSHSLGSYPHEPNWPLYNRPPQSDPAQHRSQTTSASPHNAPPNPAALVQHRAKAHARPNGQSVARAETDYYKPPSPNSPAEPLRSNQSIDPEGPLARQRHYRPILQPIHKPNFQSNKQ